MRRKEKGSRGKHGTKRPATLDELKVKRASFDEHIAAEMRRPRPDHLVISQFKKLKLLYKEQIAKLETAARALSTTECEDHSPMTADVLVFPPPHVSHLHEHHSGQSRRAVNS